MPDVTRARSTGYSTIEPKAGQHKDTQIQSEIVYRPYLKNERLLTSCGQKRPKRAAPLMIWLAACG